MGKPTTHFYFWHHLSSRLDHDQQMQTMIVMTAEDVKKQPQEVHGDLVRCGKKSLLITLVLLGITFSTLFQA